MIRFTYYWKALTDGQRDELLRDPSAFKEMLWRVPASNAYRQRNALLYLVHPDAFEPITLRQCKEGIAKCYRKLVPEDTGDVDRQIKHIREALTTDHGSDFDFHDEPLYSQWARFAWPPKKSKETSPTGENGEKNSTPPLTLEDLARQLLIPVDYLRRIERAIAASSPGDLLRPPGDGKDVCGSEARCPSRA